MSNYKSKFISKFHDKGNVLEYACLSKHTYYRVLCKAQLIYFPNTIDNLIECLNFVKDHNIRFKLLGNGSNVLFVNDYFEGIVIFTKDINREIFFYDNSIKISSSYNCMRVSKILFSKKYVGHEFLASIPGTIGGAIYMNAGIPDREIRNCLDRVEALDNNNNIVALSSNDFNFSYRCSQFQFNKYIIIYGYFNFEYSPDKVHLAKENMLKHRKMRTLKQPFNYPSCGSVFKNPNKEKGIYAAKLIESVGLKGYRLGNAQVSEIHSNFIVNLGQATGKEIYELINLIRNKVLKEENILLELEVEIVF